MIGSCARRLFGLPGKIRIYAQGIPPVRPCRVVEGRPTSAFEHDSKVSAFPPIVRAA